MARVWKNFKTRDTKIPDSLEQTLSRNIDITDAAGGGAVGSEEHVIGN